MVGILGASGCGKSTLLNCLSGRLGKGKLKGQVLYNGNPRFKKVWKSLCAFIEQDEVMYRHLTVRETLMYAAELKLPSSMTRSQKRKKVDLIIKQLGLVACQNTKIGDPDNKGISGGERKRVAIGIEIISDPSVVLLDEPTSGLDAYTALNLVSTMRDMAIDNRRITIMTVHQPRNELLDLFDYIIVLAAGGMVFSGTVPAALEHFSSVGFNLPQLTNPADFFLDITSINYDSKETEQASRDRIEIFKKTWTVVQKPLPPPQVHFAENLTHRRSWWAAFFILFRRNMIDMLRNRIVIFATVIQTTVVMLFIGLVYKDLSDNIVAGTQNRFGSFVFLGLYNAFMNVIPTVLIFPQHRQVIKRERAAGTYSASAAYMAKFASLIPLCWICSAILSAPLPFFLGLQAKNNTSEYVIFIITILIQSQAACSFGLMVGAGVHNGTTGLLISFPILIVMLLFGGLLVNLSTLPPGIYW
jgi:ABC-type multidrug transport system ATPase subunit